MNRSLLIVVGLVFIAVVLFAVLKPDSEQEPVPVAIQEQEIAEPTVLVPEEVEEVEEVAAILPETEESIPATAEVPEQQEPQEPPVPVPPSLDESDQLVPVVLQVLSEPLLQWVVPEEPVRKLVLAVDLMADGKLPQRHLPIAYAMPAFAVARENGDMIVHQSNHARLDPLVEAIITVDPKTLGKYYQAWLPTMEKAYAELGKRGSFHDRVMQLIQAIQRVGTAPVNAELARPSVFYEYADEELEERADLDKWLWRMGDENREKIQNFLREIKFYL